jgi:ABC-2 type transport system ATP-binding protein
MALVGRPELIFLDEPTAGLDPQARRATWDLIEELRGDGVTTVLTTHFMDEAEGLSDQVYIVDAGRIIAAGTPTELVHAGQENALRLVAEPHLDVAKLAASLPDGTTVHETQPGTYAIAGVVGPDLLASVATWCADHGVLAESISVQHQTLEDRFLELTGKALR